MATIDIIIMILGVILGFAVMRMGTADKLFSAMEEADKRKMSAIKENETKKTLDKLPK